MLLSINNFVHLTCTLLHSEGKSVNKFHFAAQESYRNLIWKNMLSGAKLQKHCMFAIHTPGKQTNNQ